MDWNEDGLKDLIVGENNGKIRYYRNIGSVGNPLLTFDSYVQANGIDIDIGDYSFPWINDWNEDGKKDLLVGESDGVVNLFTNIGTNASPVFGNGTLIQLQSGGNVDVGYRSGPNVVDVNGDGIKDLVSGDIYGKLYYFQNNGTNANPQLANMVTLKTGTTDIETPGTSRAAPIDWNDDGDIDFIIGSYDARLKVYFHTMTTAVKPTVIIIRTSGYMVPVSGGRVDYDVRITNSSTSAQEFDFWTEAQIPGYEWYGPILSRPNLTINPSSNLFRSMVLMVPGTIPNGIYYYYGYVGDFDALQIYSQSDFYFYKYGTDGNGYAGPWFSEGWEDAEDFTASISPGDFAHLSAAPNPFNPNTIIDYTVPENSNIRLSVYDISGREVVNLVEGFQPAGTYEAAFNGVDLASGVYFARLTTGSEVKTAKLLLVK